MIKSSAELHESLKPRTFLNLSSKHKTNTVDVDIFTLHLL